MGLKHRPFVTVTLAFTAGILVGKCAGLPLWFPAVLLMIVTAVGFRFRAHRWAGLLVLVTACLCAGMMALRSYSVLPPEHIARLLGQPVVLKARVVSDINDGSFGGHPQMSFTVEATDVTVRDAVRRTSGRVQVTVFRSVALEPGDLVELAGVLRRPSGFGGNGRLSYVDTLAGRKVMAALNVKKEGECRVLRRDLAAFWEKGARWCREGMSTVLEHYLSPGEAGLMKGLIYGERGDIADHVKNIFLRTGTTHILAVSGMNVAMVAFGIFFLLNLTPVPRLARMLLAVMLTAWYAYVAGGSSPVVRAAVMSAVLIFSFILEREQDGLNTLAVASLAILAVNPTQLFDIGFQLSFAGVLSLMLVTPPLGGLFPETCRKIWNEYLGVSIAAFLGTAGIILYYFGTVTPVSLLANIPAVPLVGLITALGALLFLFSPLSWLAIPAALALKAALNLLVYLLYLFTLIPGGFFYVEPLPALWQVILYYLLVLICIKAWLTNTSRLC
ncbi:MAG: ComEC/Rec2 family competence protein [Candidatus Omnitrophota bacterium]